MLGMIICEHGRQSRFIWNRPSDKDSLNLRWIKAYLLVGLNYVVKVGLALCIVRAIPLACGWRSPKLDVELAPQLLNNRWQPTCTVCDGTFDMILFLAGYIVGK